MYKIKKSILIDAPITKVYEFMADPANLPEIWPSMVEINNVRENSKGWSTYEWVYKMGGIKFNGESDTLQAVKNKHVTTVSTKGIQSRFDFDYSENNGKTEVTVEAEYSVPASVLSKITEQIIGKLNEHEADVMLSNLKARMEG